MVSLRDFNEFNRARREGEALTFEHHLRNRTAALVTKVRQEDRFLELESISDDKQRMARFLEIPTYPAELKGVVADIASGSPEMNRDLQREKARRPRNVVGPNGMTLRQVIIRFEYRLRSLGLKPKILFRLFIHETTRLGLDAIYDGRNDCYVIEYKGKHKVGRRRFENVVSEFKRSKRHPNFG